MRIEKINIPQLYNLTASEAATQIQQRQLSPLDLMESLLARIDALEPALKAWVYPPWPTGQQGKLAQMFSQ